MSGFGKVGFLWTQGIRFNALLVLPDNEHETLSVLMGQHTQDVKCVAWHPTSEVRTLHRQALFLSYASELV